MAKKKSSRRSGVKSVSLGTLAGGLKVARDVLFGDGKFLNQSPVNDLKNNVPGVAMKRAVDHLVTSTTGYCPGLSGYPKGFGGGATQTAVATYGTAVGGIVAHKGATALGINRGIRRVQRTLGLKRVVVM